LCNAGQSGHNNREFSKHFDNLNVKRDRFVREVKVEGTSDDRFQKNDWHVGYREWVSKVFLEKKMGEWHCTFKWRFLLNFRTAGSSSPYIEAALCSGVNALSMNIIIVSPQNGI
jgi:hypothetical protein